MLVGIAVACHDVVDRMLTPIACHDLPGGEIACCSVPDRGVNGRDIAYRCCAGHDFLWS